MYDTEEGNYLLYWRYVCACDCEIIGHKYRSIQWLKIDIQRVMKYSEYGHLKIKPLSASTATFLS